MGHVSGEGSWKGTTGTAYFFQVICEELLKYKTEQLVSLLSSPAPAATNRPIGDRLEHNPCNGSNIIESEDERRCVVCGLEARQFERFGERMARLRPNDCDKIKQKVEEAGKEVRRKVATCQTCGISAHNFKLNNNERLIHAMFQERTCMEIAHCETGRQIWNRKTNEREGRRRTGVRSKHKVMQDLRLAVEANICTTTE